MYFVCRDLLMLAPEAAFVHSMRARSACKAEFRVKKHPIEQLWGFLPPELSMVLKEMTYSAHSKVINHTTIVLTCYLHTVRVARLM